jgi:hypothetical protein
MTMGASPNLSFLSFKNAIVPQLLQEKSDFLPTLLNYPKYFRQLSLAEKWVPKRELANQPQNLSSSGGVNYFTGHSPFGHLDLDVGP